MIVEAYDEETRRYQRSIKRKELLTKPVKVDYQFMPEITKIFGKGGTIE